MCINFYNYIIYLYCTPRHNCPSWPRGAAGAAAERAPPTPCSTGTKTPSCCKKKTLGIKGDQLSASLKPLNTIECFVMHGGFQVIRGPN